MFASSWEMQIEAASGNGSHHHNGDGSNRRCKQHAATCPRHAQNAGKLVANSSTLQHQQQQQQCSTTQRSNANNNHQSATAGGRSGGFSLRHFLDSIFSSQHQTAPSKEEAEAQQLRKLLADYEQFYGCEMEMREQSNVLPIMWDVGTLDRLVLGREQIQKNFKLTQLKIDASLTLELDPSVVNQSQCLIHTAAEQGIHCDSNEKTKNFSDTFPEDSVSSTASSVTTRMRKRGRGTIESATFADENKLVSATASTSSLLANNNSPRPYATSTTLQNDQQRRPETEKIDLIENQFDPGDSNSLEPQDAVRIDTTLDIPVTLTIDVTPTCDRHHNPSRRGRPYVKALIIRLLKSDEKISTDSETYRDALHHLRLQSAAIEESEKERMPAMLNPENATHSMSSNMVMFTLPYRLPHVLANPLRLSTATEGATLPQVFQPTSSSSSSFPYEPIRQEKRQKLSDEQLLDQVPHSSTFMPALSDADSLVPSTFATNRNAEQLPTSRSIRILIMCQVNDVFKLRCLVQHKRLQNGHWRSLLIDRLSRFSLQTQEQLSIHNSFTASLTKKALLKCVDGERLVDLSNLILIVPALKYVSMPSTVPDAVRHVFTRLINTCGGDDAGNSIDVAGGSSKHINNTAYCSDASVAAMFQCKWHVQLVDLLLKLRCQNENERTGVGALVDRLSYAQLIDALLQYMEVVRVELVQRLVEKVGDRWLRDSSCLLLDAIDAIQPGDKRRAICRIFQPYAEFLSILQEHETHTMMDNRQLQVLQELIAASH